MRRKINGTVKGEYFHLNLNNLQLSTLLICLLLPVQNRLRDINLLKIILPFQIHLGQHLFSFPILLLDELLLFLKHLKLVG